MADGPAAVTSGLSRNRSWDNARKLRGIYFIDADDGGFRETFQKHARKKLKIPMETATPCSLRTTKRPNKLLETDREIKGSNKIKKAKYACIVEVHESTTKRLESSLPKDRDDHNAVRSTESTYRLKVEPPQSSSL